MKDDGKLSALATLATPRRSNLSHLTPEEKRVRRLAQQREWRSSPEQKQKTSDKNKAYYDEYLTTPERREAKASYLKDWRGSNPDKSRDGQLRKNYGITLIERDEMLTSQGNVCAICATDTPGKLDWSTDHCHTKGHVRGILCQSCNLMLGHAKDNPATLAAAITYLAH